MFVLAKSNHSYLLTRIFSSGPECVHVFYIFIHHNRFLFLYLSSLFALFLFYFIFLLFLLLFYSSYVRLLTHTHTRTRAHTQMLFIMHTTTRWLMLNLWLSKIVSNLEKCAPIYLGTTTFSSRRVSLILSIHVASQRIYYLLLLLMTHHCIYMYIFMFTQISMMMMMIFFYLKIEFFSPLELISILYFDMNA